MASIYGFEIRNIKTFKGREWDGCQGSIYYKGKKVGWYNNDGNGGCADIDFYFAGEGRAEVEEALKAAVKEYFTRYPLGEDYSQIIPDDELFFAELIDLQDLEKRFKRYSKEGPTYLVSYTEVKSGFGKVAVSHGEDIFEIMRKALKDGVVNEVREYRSLSDFCIE